MAICTYTKAEMNALVKRLMNRVNSPMFDATPEVQRDIKALCLLSSTMLPHAPVESITIECKNRNH
jgi:hypothetical protein